MSRKRNDYFWLSYSDLMTSLFFVMLVLFVLVFSIMQYELGQKNQVTIDLINQLSINDSIKERLKVQLAENELVTDELRSSRNLLLASFFLLPSGIVFQRRLRVVS